MSYKRQGLIGVYQYSKQSQRFVARIGVSARKAGNKQSYPLGVYDTPNEAAIAYDSACRYLQPHRRRKNLRLNFPDLLTVACPPEILKASSDGNLYTVMRLDKVSDVELAYMAGLIDGEGSICVFPTHTVHRKYPNKKWPSYIAVIALANTDVKMMDWISDTIGGKYHRAKTNKKPDKWKPRYGWRVGGVMAASLAQHLLPYLVVKKHQAELLLEFVGTLDHGRRSIPSREVLARRVAIYHELKTLNHRGPLVP